MKRCIAVAVLAVLPGLAAAQDEVPALPDEPAVSTDKTPDRPRAPARAPEAPAPRAGQPAQAQTGTTVIGEQEAPIGLYIMPWRQSAAQGGLDRPARLLDEALMPLDPDVFRRQVEYHRALSEHLEKTGRATP